MKPTAPPARSHWLLPLFLSASAIVAVVAVVVAVEREPPRPAPEPAPSPVALVAVPPEAIPEEAGVFRTVPAMMAIPPDTRRTREAHPRTLRTFRYLRAYPGAPPRIPHELTAEEFRSAACNTCHERGGYSKRFSAYAPLTPHPERSACLQCHLGGDSLMAVSLVSRDPNRRCHQCHATGGSPRPQAETPFDWRSAAGAGLPPPAPGQPPVILHGSGPRGNCVACHAGPAAVAEIRTSHPDRADCRQCHLEPDPTAMAFSRAAGARTTADGAAP